MNNISKINFFDFEVDNLSMDETISLIDSQIKKNKIIQHVVVNVAKLVNSRKDKILSDSISNADIINIDGAGVVYGMKILGYAPKERYWNRFNDGTIIFIKLKKIIIQFIF